MNDSEFAQHSAMLRAARIKTGSGDRPLVFDFESLECSYTLPKGRIGGIHIVATDRQDWIKSAA